jgi:GNAT superfamily N-acetyltransferase
VLEPWEHGTVVRTTRYPRYFDFNVVRVEDDPRLSVDALVEFAGEDVAVEELPYDAVRDLWVAWHLEDFPDQDPIAHHAEARDVALRRHAQVLAVLESDAPVAFAQLERDGDAAEITQVYVRPEYRGDGRGTAITREAIHAAGDARDLWIVADDEDRPKQLYARLGFRPAWTAMEFLRLP